MDRQLLQRIVEQTDTPAGRVFDLAVQALILFSLVTFSVDTLPDLPPTVRSTLHVAEAATVVLFTLEYLLRISVSSRPLSYIFSFFGLVDLLAILPFYLAATVDLRSLRAFRLLRLFRILKLARYNRAVRRFHRALLIAREELVLFFVLSAIILFLAASGIYHFENSAQPEAFASVFHSLWWAIVTLTTVGYGDVYPVTLGGRVFTCLVLIAGLGVVAVPAGIVASALDKAREMEE